MMTTMIINRHFLFFRGKGGSNQQQQHRLGATPFVQCKRRTRRARERRTAEMKELEESLKKEEEEANKLEAELNSL